MVQWISDKFWQAEARTEETKRFIRDIKRVTRRKFTAHFNRGGVVSWGIVPTESATLNKESPETLATKLTGFWNILANTSGIDIVQIAEQSMLAPARCCLRNPQESGPLRKQPSMDSQPDSGNPIEETLVEKAFSYLKDLSSMFRDIYAV